MITGYGSYGHNIELSYLPEYISLIERGWIIAMTHVRGGGEMGKNWYKQGKLFNKKNSFYDFIDCAEYLISNKYTNSSILNAYSSSAGGLLLASVANLKPNLLNAMIIKVPFVDILNTILDKSLPLSEHEYEEWVMIQFYRLILNIEGKPRRSSSI